MITSNRIKPFFEYRGYNSYTVVSLFAGAGGMDMGFHNQGFKILWANDIDKDACATHMSWSNSIVVQSDIGTIDLDNIPDCDVILGGFPCQGFSLAGPRKIDDKRNSLYRYFVKLVEHKQPSIFVAENVKGLLTLGNGSILDAIVSDFSNKGYQVSYYLVNAADYNIPQDRFRVFLVGLRKDLRLSFKFPEPFRTKVSIEKALCNIPTPKVDDICYESYSPRYMSRNRKRNWHEVSYTIPAMAKHVPLHPSSPDMVKVDTEIWMFGEGKTRRFSWQEAAAIQTFPTGMEFYGCLTSKYRQIGNAVPVKLAEALASSLHTSLSKLYHLNQDIQLIAGSGI